LPTREEFIETQAAFQFGACAAPKGLDVAGLARQQAKPQGSLFFHDPGERRFIPAEIAAALSCDESGHWRFTQPPGKEIVGGAKLSIERQADILNELADAGLQLPLMVDMHDAIRRENAFPVFQYNRAIGAKNSILWPLQRVHSIGTRSFCSPPDPGEKPLREKKPGLSWRGAIRGFVFVEGKPINIRVFVARFQNNQIDREALLRHLEALPRYQFVSRYFDREDFDIGFNNRAQDRKGWSDLPEIARYQKPFADTAAQAEYKYVFSIQGTDVGSSFGCKLSKTSIILRETYPWEVFFDCHFRPWEHYVPIKPDFSDIPEKIDWCETHPHECQRMINLRHELVHLLLDEEARREALRRVVARYSDFYRSGNFLPQPPSQ